LHILSVLLKWESEEKLCKKWLVIDEKLAYRKVINCINKSYHKNGRKYLRLNINGAVRAGNAKNLDENI
jgi:hypothetical protein